jgi:hypothetical protein
MLLKIGNRVAEFFPFKSLPQSHFKVRKSCKRNERKHYVNLVICAHMQRHEFPESQENQV